jgi:hypothetical protein
LGQGAIFFPPPPPGILSLSVFGSHDSARVQRALDTRTSAREKNPAGTGLGHEHEDPVDHLTTAWAYDTRQ